MTNIFHIADFDLSHRFKKHPEAQETLVEARYKTLQMVVDEPNKLDADIFAIARDLFDLTSMKADEIQHVDIPDYPGPPQSGLKKYVQSTEILTAFIELRNVWNSG